jgi:hypothetical protein
VDRNPSKKGGVVSLELSMAVRAARGAVGGVRRLFVAYSLRRCLLLLLRLLLLLLLLVS